MPEKMLSRCGTLTGGWYIHRAFIEKRIFWTEGVTSKRTIFRSAAEEILFRRLKCDQLMSVGVCHEQLHRAPVTVMPRTRPAPESNLLSSLLRSSRESRGLVHCLFLLQGGAVRTLLSSQKVIRVRERT